MVFLIFTIVFLLNKELYVLLSAEHVVICGIILFFILVRKQLTNTLFLALDGYSKNIGLTLTAALTKTKTDFLTESDKITAKFDHAKEMSAMFVSLDTKINVVFNKQAFERLVTVSISSKEQIAALLKKSNILLTSK